MRIVVDTNVLVSAIFWGGQPHRLLATWIVGRMMVCATTHVLTEYCEVIDRLAARCGRPDLAKRWKSIIHSLIPIALRGFTGI